MHHYHPIFAKLLYGLIVFGVLNATPAFADEDKATRRTKILMRKMQMDMQAQIDQQMAEVEKQKTQIAEQQSMIDELSEYKNRANSLASAKRSLTKQNENL